MTRDVFRKENVYSGFKKIAYSSTDGYIPHIIYLEICLILDYTLRDRGSYGK